MRKAKVHTESLYHDGSIMTIFYEKKQRLLLLKAPFYKLLSIVSTKSANHKQFLNFIDRKTYSDTP